VKSKKTQRNANQSNHKGEDMRSTNSQGTIRKLATLLVLGATTLGYTAAANATESFQNTSAMLTYTNKSKTDSALGSGTTNESLSTLRVEHFGDHGFGDNYFFVDVMKGDQLGGPKAGSFGYDSNQGAFFVWNARASFSKISGSKVSFGPISDISLMYRMERGSYANYSANMVGPSFNFAVPGFALLQTSFLANRQDHSFATADDRKTHLFWHTAAIVPFELGSLKFTFMPLIWANFSDGANGTQVYVEPDLWMKVANSPLELGFRLNYHHHKDYTRTSPTLLAKWNF
jgi:nucleoside-specific outer membrane channel protein Tsx